MTNVVNFLEYELDENANAVIWFPTLFKNIQGLRKSQATLECFFICGFL
jgi:hypothetical protein